jgi:hypothetical protein
MSMVTARCIGFNLVREDKLDLFFPKVENFADSCRTDQEGWSKLWLFLGAECWWASVLSPECLIIFSIWA